MRKFSLKILSGSFAGLSQSFGVSSAMTLWEQCLPFPGLAHAKSIENSRFNFFKFMYIVLSEKE